jgi:hypothetical protein
MAETRERLGQQIQTKDMSDMTFYMLYTHHLRAKSKLYPVRYGTGWHIESWHEALDSNSLASIGQDVGTKCALLQVSCGGCEFYVQEGTLYRRGQACNPSACTGQL